MITTYPRPTAEDTTAAGASLLTAVAVAIAVVTALALALGLLAVAVGPATPAAPAAEPPAASVIPTAPPAPEQQGPDVTVTPATTHVVAPGETLADIAVRYGVPSELLAADNGIDDPDRVLAGQQLTIAVPPSDVVVIADGATMSGYAASRGMSMGDLAALNPQIPDPDHIVAGGGLRIARS